MNTPGLGDDDVVAAMSRFREEHRYCGYDAPFGPVWMPDQRVGYG
jgi:hypothetical protein